MTSHPTGRWFAQRADQIIGSMWTADYASIVSEIDRLAADATKRRDGKATVVKFQRVISDLRVLASHKKRRPFDECDALYLARADLGFPALADEAIAVGAHARYCREMGEIAAAANYAAGVLKKVEANRRTAKPPIPAELEALLQSMSGAV